MKIYKSIAFASLVIGTVLCIVGFFMNGISELPDETQKLSKYVTIRWGRFRFWCYKYYNGSFTMYTTWFRKWFK